VGDLKPIIKLLPTIIQGGPQESRSPKTAGPEKSLPHTGIQPKRGGGENADSGEERDPENHCEDPSYTMTGAVNRKHLKKIPSGILKG